MNLISATGRVLAALILPASVASLGPVAVAVLVAGLTSSAAAAPTQAGKIATNRMWATAGNNKTPNPIPPKAVRDHRRGICSPWAKTADDCRKPPGY